MVSQHMVPRHTVSEHVVSKHTVPERFTTTSNASGFIRRAMRAFLIALFAVSISACANQVTKQLGQGVNGQNGQNGGPVVPGTPREFAVKVGDIVYFTTDSTTLTPEARQTLHSQARWLNQYPQFNITIQGHADERGTREYNIALGAKRATATKRFLVSQGVRSARMRTISYGKERPVAVCNDISCWSQNRRAKTVLNRRAAS